MTEKLENRIFNKFKKIFPSGNLKRRSNPRKSRGEILERIECDDGWYELIYSVCEKIQKYVDERTKEIALSIANNPMLAFDFGTQIDLVGKNDETNNFKKYTYHLRVPHPSIFSHLKGGNFENVSDDGVKTELLIFLPMYNKDKIEVNVEENQKFSEDTIGQIIKDGNDKIFLHKKDIGRATVFGISGFRGTLIFEDNYEYRITDNYQSYSDDGILYNVKVRYSGSKKEINFEKLEGRRYYLRRLIEKIISTASITDYKFKLS